MPPKKKIPKGTVLIVDRHERDQTARTVTVQPYQRKHVPRGPNKKPTKYINPRLQGGIHPAMLDAAMCELSVTAMASAAELAVQRSD